MPQRRYTFKLFLNLYLPVPKYIVVLIKKKKNVTVTGQFITCKAPMIVLQVMALYKSLFIIIIIIHVVWSAARWHDHAPRSAAVLCGEIQKNTEIRHAMNYDRADTGC